MFGFLSRAIAPLTTPHGLSNPAGRDERLLGRHGAKHLFRVSLSLSLSLSPKIRISTETRARKVRKEAKEGGNEFHGKSRSLDWRTRVSDGGGGDRDRRDQTRLCPRAA